MYQSPVCSLQLLFIDVTTKAYLYLHSIVRVLFCNLWRYSPHYQTVHQPQSYYTTTLAYYPSTTLPNELHYQPVHQPQSYRTPTLAYYLSTTLPDEPYYQTVQEPPELPYSSPCILPFSYSSTRNPTTKPYNPQRYNTTTLAYYPATISPYKLHLPNHTGQDCKCLCAEWSCANVVSTRRNTESGVCPS